MDEAARSAACLDCGQCCQSLVMEVPRPISDAGMARAVEWLTARGLQVLPDPDGFITSHLQVKVPLPCPHLSQQAPWVCDIYETRPAVCREFDGRGSVSVDCKWDV